MIVWLAPPDCDPPHPVTRSAKLEALIRDLQQHGWRRGHPALLGYPLEDRVQLLTGAHRWAACVELQRLIPVDLMAHETVVLQWGDDDWITLVNSPPLIEH